MRSRARDVDPQGAGLSTGRSAATTRGGWRGRWVSRRAIGFFADQRAIGFFALATLSSGAALAPVLFAPGWPMNHEGTAWAARLAAHVSALRAGDLFPLWWNEGALGLGAPMPLLYHKLFNIVAGPLYLAAGSYRAAAAIAVFLFSVLGVYGLRAAGSVLIEARASRWLALVFPHLNYALTDWLVRGAFAEFAAMAVGTWLLWWCLRLACTGRVERGLPLIALCLLLAHAVIAALGAVIVALAVLVRTVRHRAEALAVLRRLVAPAAATALVTAPLAILMLFTLGRVNTETLVRDFHPTRQFVAVTRYVHDRSYR